MNQPLKEKHSLSRRDALKALAAATGAISLSNLPKSWEPPQIEVGLLPAHAQASPTDTPPDTAITLSNLSIDLFGTTNNCVGTGTGLVGTLHDTTFDYKAPAGGVVSGLTIEQVSDFSGTSETVEITVGYLITGTEFEGTISYSTCVHFAGSSNMQVTISITTPGGETSNTVSVTVPAPPGAMGEEENTGSNTTNYKKL